MPNFPYTYAKLIITWHRERQKYSLVFIQTLESAYFSNSSALKNSLTEESIIHATTIGFTFLKMKFKY